MKSKLKKESKAKADSVDIVKANVNKKKSIVKPKGNKKTPPKQPKKATKPKKSKRSIKTPDSALPTPRHIDKLVFLAAISRTSQRQSATQLDNTYAIEFKTNNFNILDLGKVPPLRLVRVTVEVLKENDRAYADTEKSKYYE